MRHRARLETVGVAVAVGDEPGDLRMAILDVTEERQAVHPMCARTSDDGVEAEGREHLEGEVGTLHEVGIHHLALIREGVLQSNDDMLVLSDEEHTTRRHLKPPC